MPRTVSASHDVIKLTRDRIDVVLRGRDKGWDFASSLRTLNDETAHEYEDRFVFELLQNAYDANPSGRTDGRALFQLHRSDDGAVLYAANTGRPFQLKDVKALSDLARSTKPPGEGIGNKGLGFRSVLQVSSSPEVFSSATTDATTNGEQQDGYCFGFATEANIDGFEDLADEDIAYLKHQVHPLNLPVPRTCDDMVVRELMNNGFATVIRLPLKSEAAIELTLDRLEDLRDSGTPVLLFLDRLRQLDVIYRGFDGYGSFTLMRSVRKVNLAFPEAVEGSVVTTDEEAYAVFRRSIGEERMRSAIRESVDAGELAESWLDWRGDAAVSIAVPVDDGAVEGFFFTFLPMSVEAPFAGHANAPFYTKMSRQHLNLRVPLNEFLIRELAELAIAALHTLTGSTDSTWRRVYVDLLAWAPPHHRFMVDALRKRREVQEIKLPSLARGAAAWSPIRDVVAWPEEINGDFLSAAGASANRLGSACRCAGAKPLCAVRLLRRGAGACDSPAHPGCLRYRVGGSRRWKPHRATAPPSAIRSRPRCAVSDRGDSRGVGCGGLATSGVDRR